MSYYTQYKEMKSSIEVKAKPIGELKNGQIVKLIKNGKILFLPIVLKTDEWEFAYDLEGNIYNKSKLKEVFTEEGLMAVPINGTIEIRQQYDFKADLKETLNELLEEEIDLYEAVDDIMKKIKAICS